MVPFTKIGRLRGDRCTLGQGDHLNLDMAIGHPCGEGEWPRVHVLEVELKI